MGSHLTPETVLTENIMIRGRVLTESIMAVVCQRHSFKKQHLTSIDLDFNKDVESLTLVSAKTVSFIHCVDFIRTMQIHLASVAIYIALNTMLCLDDCEAHK